MHTATYLNRDQFDVTVGGHSGDLDALLPAWQPHDRLGIVVDQPLGLIGASLLIQAASLLFYEADEDRRWAHKQYPEIYAFLIDGPHGELGPFDFAPLRKEVVVSSNRDEVIAAIHDRAITRLAVVDGPPVEHDYEFHDVNPALERITSAFAYSPAGRVADADVTVVGTPKLEWNVEMLLDTDRSIDFIVNMSREQIIEFEPQLLEPDFHYDPDAFVGYMRSREGEVSPADRARLQALRAEVVANGVPTETYRRLTVPEALARLVPSRGPRRHD